ncbi:MAG: hypothetical protein M3Y31_09850, partial [Gemmatimonadota bacterium]|nr:hypothetical protein [Gemmatimonadota bacterium]
MHPVQEVPLQSPTSAVSRPPRLGLVVLACVAAAIGCGDDTLTEPQQQYAKGGTPPSPSASPASLAFTIPGAEPATVVVTVQYATEMMATVSGTCAAVAPATANTVRRERSSVYAAEFTVTAEEAGSCTVNFTDRKGRAVSVPVTVTRSSIAPRVETIGAGANHTCAIAPNGRTYCWGFNQWGQVGDATGITQFAPTLVNTALTFSSLAIGAHHSCALTADGGAWCWGLNGFGQLGDGSTTDRSTPVAVAAPAGGSPLDFVLLTAGELHTCGLTAEGAAWCWGRNNYGQLGVPLSNVPQLTPVPVSGGHVFTTLSADAIHTCGITADGTAYCWGNNEADQLGTGSFVFADEPTAVSGGLSFATIAAGGVQGVPAHTCGATTTGALWCWGDNAFGQLGDGTNADRPAPAQVGAPGFAVVAAGGRSTCALASSGAAYCWGSNTSGQLGTGDFAEWNAPVPVVGPADGAPPLAYVSLTAGGAHACGRTADGSLYCWGDNVSGQLGTGPQGLRPRPLLVSFDGGSATIASLVLESTTV